jgi:hypothetical protein|eukprot:6058451-Prymnesium_polylepis.1
MCAHDATIQLHTFLVSGETGVSQTGLLSGRAGERKRSSQELTVLSSTEHLLLSAVGPLGSHSRFGARSAEAGANIELQFDWSADAEAPKPNGHVPRN